MFDWVKRKIDTLVTNLVELQEERAQETRLLCMATTARHEAARDRAAAERELDEARAERRRRVGNLEAEAAALEAAVIRLSAQRNLEERKRNTGNRYNFDELTLWEDELQEREAALRVQETKLNARVAELYALRKERAAQAVLAHARANVPEEPT